MFAGGRTRLFAAGGAAGVSALYWSTSTGNAADGGGMKPVCFDRVIKGLPYAQQTCVRAPVDRLDSDCRVCQSSLPTITLEAVRDEELRGKEGRCWVTLAGGVYDVTEFLEAHPGGQTRILMVDGLDLAKFWEIYTLHDRQHIRDLLEDYRIANLSEADAARAYATTPDLPSMYENDPERPKAVLGKLRVATTHPWNSEPADIRELVETFYTPNDLFFVRNHNAVPEVDAGGESNEWRLEIEENEELGIKACEFTLDELKTKFPRYDVVATLQCAGNRQEDFVTKDRPLYVAPHWRNGAIGCARWSGVRVRDVLGAAGLPVDEMALGKVDLSEHAKIVNFVADDIDETGVPYAGVIPVEKAVDPFGDTILAYEMNGQPLPRDHGYPVRLLAPGTAGCRNVKWVRNISVTAAASELDSGSKLDRHFAPDVEFKPAIRKGEEHLRLDQGPVIQTLPVQSIICDPLNASIVPGRRCMSDACSIVDSVTVRGVAWSGGGRGICRVEVSGDGGEKFTAAELNRTYKTSKLPVRASECDVCVGAQCPPPLQLDAPPPQQGVGRNWAWKQFEEVIPLSAEQRAMLQRGEPVELEIVAKAIDGDFNSQPEKMSHTYNVLGICVNHWHRVKVTVDPRFSSDSLDIPKAEPVPPPGYYNARHSAKT